MTEPTKRQHDLLEEISRAPGTRVQKNNSDGLDLHWELVRAGYLKNLVAFSHDWTFLLTEQGAAYLKTFNDIDLSDALQEK